MFSNPGLSKYNGAQVIILFFGNVGKYFASYQIYVYSTGGPVVENN